LVENQKKIQVDQKLLLTKMMIIQVNFQLIFHQFHFHLLLMNDINVDKQEKTIQWKT
jgi:hypothetical protein